jgi:hypothetical protein
MRKFVLFFALSVCACSFEQATEEDLAAESQALEEDGALDVRERWCRSYKSERFCPRNVCVWIASPAPGYCTLPPTE